MSVLTEGKRVIQRESTHFGGCFSCQKNTLFMPKWHEYSMVKCISMRQDIQWFYNHIGLSVTRNGRDFIIKNQQYAEYAWDLQENHQFVYE